MKCVYHPKYTGEPFPTYICNVCYDIWLDQSKLAEHQYYLHIKYEPGAEHAGSTRINSGPHCNHEFELMLDNGVYSKCKHCKLNFYPPDYQAKDKALLPFTCNNEFGFSSPQSFPPHFCKQCNIDYRTNNGKFEHHNREDHFFSKTELYEIYSMERTEYLSSCQAYWCHICGPRNGSVWIDLDHLRKHEQYYHNREQLPLLAPTWQERQNYLNNTPIE